MKTLIVDDQYVNKAEVVAKVLKRIGAIDVEMVATAKDALRKMKESKYDLLILDLQIPSEIGEPVDILGGKVLLEFVEVNNDINKPTCVLAITAHKESFEESKEFFSQRGWSIILGVEDEDFLYSVLLTQYKHLSGTSSSFDIAIITALAHTELEAILKLPCSWVKHKEPNDFNIYYAGRITTSNGLEKTLIATCLPNMGMSAAAATTTRVCLKFRPSFLIMTGIAGGVKGKVQLGDILVADPCWDWGSGKLTIKDGNAKFLSAPTQVPLDSTLRPIFRELSASRTYLDHIYMNWKEGKRPEHDLNLHLGPVATGAVVLEDTQTLELIISQHRETVGVEMEAYGFMSAAFNSGPNPPKAIVIKSVCDFADPFKNNEWQSYAAYTSASIAFQVIQNHLFNN